MLSGMPSCCMMFALRYLWSRLRLRLSNLVRWHLAASRPRSTIVQQQMIERRRSGSLCFGHQCRFGGKPNGLSVRGMALHSKRFVLFLARPTSNEVGYT